MLLLQCFHVRTVMQLVMQHARVQAYQAQEAPLNTAGCTDKVTRNFTTMVILYWTILLARQCCIPAGAAA